MPRIGVNFWNPHREYPFGTPFVVSLYTHPPTVEGQVYEVTQDLHWANVKADVETLRQLHDVYLRINFEVNKDQPTNEYELETYLAVVTTLAQAPEFNHENVYAVCGNEPNLTTANPVQAKWAARVFNGYGTPDEDTGNFMQIWRTFSPMAKMLPAPIAPYAPFEADFDDRVNTGQNNTEHSPWADYMLKYLWYVQEAGRRPQNWPRRFQDDWPLPVHVYTRSPISDVDADPNDHHEIMSKKGWRFSTNFADTVREIVDELAMPNPIAVLEWDTAVGVHDVSKTYRRGMLLHAFLRCVQGVDNLTAFCLFVDRDPGGWSTYSAENAIGSCAALSADLDYLLGAKV